MGVLLSFAGRTEPAQITQGEVRAYLDVRERARAASLVAKKQREMLRRKLLAGAKVERGLWCCWNDAGRFSAR